MRDSSTALVETGSNPSDSTLLKDAGPSDTGPAVMVHLAVGSDDIVATVTRRAVADLELERGVTAYAILKAMAVARDQIAGAPERNRGET